LNAKISMNLASSDAKLTATITAEAQDSTLRSRVQRQLRNAILDGRYEAGQKLVERELCELTGASRSILGEALVGLEANAPGRI
jgi:DNA-binding GntR family transcriptional regulator